MMVAVKLRPRFVLNNVTDRCGVWLRVENTTLSSMTDSYTVLRSRKE
jgi:hypothetical protein